MIDNEIRKLLIEEGVRFKEDSLEIDDSLGDLEVEVKDGLFSMDNSEARYGEFYDLETLLIKKGFPFDRISGMDWNRPPERRIFRPGQPNFDYFFLLIQRHMRRWSAYRPFRNCWACQCQRMRFRPTWKNTFPATRPWRSG